MKCLLSVCLMKLVLLLVWQITTVSDANDANNAGVVSSFVAGYNMMNYR